MAIGSSINVSVPTVGTTVESLAKARDAFFTGNMTISSNDYPFTLSLRPAGTPTSNRRRFGATYKVSPADSDAPAVSSKGSCTVSVNIDANIGTVITAAELENQVLYALSAMLSTDVIGNLLAGSDQ